MKKRHTQRAPQRPTRRKPRAKTADVLGTPLRKERIPSKWRAHYDHLIELSGHLAQRQADLVRDASEGTPSFSNHMADAGTDTYDRDFALGMLSSEQDAAYEINEALARIRNGSYGICEVTSKPISPRRLQAIPWTRFSAEAEKQLERDHAVNHARVGPLESLSQSEPNTEEEEAETTE